MGECPLCGQPTYKASTRLIKDACGHTKCRLCLLQEENGCSVCKETSSYESYNNKPIKLVNIIPEKISHISCLSIDRGYMINKESHNIQKKLHIGIEKKSDKIEKNNSSHYETTVKPFTNEDEFNKHLSSFKPTKVNQLSSTIESIVDNISEEYNSTNSSVTEEKFSAEKASIKNEPTNVEKHQKEKKFYTHSNIKPFEILTEKDLDKIRCNDYLSIEKNFPTLENKTTGEKIEENQKEKLDCDDSNKTSNKFLFDRSPDFKISDYLFFKNINENITQNELIRSPAQAPGYRSPDFQLSDYVLLKKKSSIEKSATEIEEENQNEEVDDNKMDIASPPSITNQNLHNFYQPISSVIDRGTVVGQDVIEKEKQCQIERVNYDHLKCYEFPSYSVLEKKLRDNENLINKVENNHNKEKDNDELNSSSTEKIAKASECDKIEVNQSEKIEDDEDKENKEKHNERKEKDININEENNDQSVSILSVNHETPKPKDKIENDEGKEKDKKLKSSINHTKHKNTKEKSKKKDVQISIRKGKRKRKPKVLIYEDNFEETKRVSIKRRKQGKDWSHIVTLPGTTVTYKCTFCEKIFKSPRGKWYHSSCLTGQAPFRCNVCGRTFVKRSHFEYHESMHTGNKPFRCDVCDKSFIQKSKLNRHLLIHKQQNDIECAECGRRFSTKQYLKNHLTIHQNNFFKCKFCPKTFTLAFNRKRHERSHSTDRPYKCDICSKDFKGKFLLTRHRRTHDKNRPFSCHNCHRVFLSKFEVQRHMSVHSDIKPYACNRCNLEFRRKDNLNRHIKHHHTIDYDPLKSEESNTKNVDEKSDSTAININSSVNNKSTNEEKQSNVKRTSKLKDIMDKPLTNLKPKAKPKRISRSNSAASSKSLLKTSLSSPQSHRQINSKPDLSNAVPVIRGPISINRFTETSEILGTRLGFTQPIPLEEAVVLNRQIEEKIYTQDSFCNYPGLNCRANSIVRRRDSCGSNSNSNDDTGIIHKQIQERSKTVHFSKDDPNDAQKGDEPKVVKDINLHWRRRTAESLRIKIIKNKQTQGLAQN